MGCRDGGEVREGLCEAFVVAIMKFDISYPRLLEETLMSERLLWQSVSEDADFAGRIALRRWDTCS